MALVHLLVSSQIPAASCCLVDPFLTSSVMADTMLIVYLYVLTISDVLPSVMFHGALFASSFNVCLRHSWSSARSSDDSWLLHGISGVVLFPHLSSIVCLSMWISNRIGFLSILCSSSGFLPFLDLLLVYIFQNQDFVWNLIAP